MWFKCGQELLQSAIMRDLLHDTNDGAAVGYETMKKFTYEEGKAHYIR